jgi:hypothetical protein
MRRATGEHVRATLGTPQMGLSVAPKDDQSKSDVGGFCPIQRPAEWSEVWGEKG